MLRTIIRTAISIRRAPSLDEATREQMWALYAPHHNTDRAEFDRRLAVLDEVALFSRRRDGTLIGFCGIRRRVVQLTGGRRVAAFYLGLCYLQPAWRSNAIVQRMVLRRVLGPWLSPRFDRVYFWSDCLTYRPYLAMARNLREYYPSRTRADSAEVREVIAALGSAYYGDSFDQQRGTVRKRRPRIKGHEAFVSATDLHDPDIRFYMDRNRDYDRGDGMIAICPVSLANVVHLLGRQLRKEIVTRRAPARSSTATMRTSA
ncbi:hypothetical protein [Mycobacterium spongiae]|uniref:Uncharacterized protein n=1 Tax=Mycobacterium spongiae TaxID=886343 RepID=A0A975JVN6_9MYCO|nr:hypothetical protein [Mycobacterium spongiae]QUR66511.1 hypothetical protein F6B93_04885 [Mycobacterium spongiae]